MTSAFIPLCRCLTKFTNLGRQPNFVKIYHIASRLTESKAFVKSMKTMYNGLCCSLHFSCNCLKVNTMSVLLLPLWNVIWKPHWDSEKSSSAVVSTSLFKRKIILGKILLAVDNNEIPCQFPQSLLSPFLLEIVISWASSRSFGIISVSQMCKITLTISSVKVSPPLL